MSSLARIKYLIFSPWEVSEKGPYNKYHSGQFHHTARQLMASFALTETLQMLVYGMFQACASLKPWTYTRRAGDRLERRVLQVPVSTLTPESGLHRREIHPASP